MISNTLIIFWIFTLLATGKAALAQPQITVQFTVVSRQASQDARHDAGLLIDVKNLTDRDVALYTPLGLLVNYIKYYKRNPKTQQYQEIVHPLVQELAAERAYKDSLYAATQIIADFFGANNYNTKSTLYLEFNERDSLWFDYIVRSAQYEKQIKDTELQQFKTASGISTKSLFTLLKGREHYQDFFNIAFLYKEKGDYKIVLDLPPIHLQKAVYLADTFAVTEIPVVSCHPVYLSIR
ncbi:hypothetical protein LX87_01696 [Larkinella arboricola]|uniref:Uncharacterized protein n=1 Tax=Larkinella arboricola TaxID=643671 RepID=A0A327X2W7_LARAB|nr:hypothetical protein [Larkinella arboricola]RAJ99998.1 hypothetical protein LX87_01696 [Larkinella arboricola]